MGEAKRRKFAETHSDRNDPVVKLKENWTEKGPTRVQDFRVPEGTIAITFDVQGVDPSTVVINPEDYYQFIPAMKSLTNAYPYYSVVQMLAQEFKRARLSGEDQSLNILPWLALWTAYQHPESGEAMRKRVSLALRKEGKAHISWHYGDNGLAMSLADQFVDLEPLAAEASKGRVTTVVDAPEPEQPMH